MDSRAPALEHPVTALARRKYFGAIARGYDAQRAEEAKRYAEERIIRDMLGDLPGGTQVLDIPVGTGWLLPLYAELGLPVIGLDVSEDMRDEAKGKIIDSRTIIRYGDILVIDEPDRSVDVALCIRLLNWLGPEDAQKALRELQRVSRRRVIFNVRVRDHKRARGYDLIEAALDGWRVAQDVECGDPDYRMIELRPSA